MPQILYRDGRETDSQRLAELIVQASGGMAEFLFDGIIDGLTPAQIIAHQLAGDNYPHTYKNAIVAEFDQMVVGMALSFPAWLHRITDEMIQFFPADRLAYLEDFYSARVENSLLLDALAVDPAHRQTGIGSQLISLTKQKAWAHNFNAVSLILFSDNRSAYHLYERNGFKVVRPIKLEPRGTITYQGGCLLMCCEPVRR